MSNRIESAMPDHSAVAQSMDPGNDASVLDMSRDQLRQGAASLRNHITERPGTCLAIAAAAGLALGWIIKRK